MAPPTNKKFVTITCPREPDKYIAEEYTVANLRAAFPKAIKDHNVRNYPHPCPICKRDVTGFDCMKINADNGIIAIKHSF